MDPYEPELHVGEEHELEPDTISRVPLKKSEIMEFLKRDLDGILIWNPSSEREEPVVWLARGPDGEVTYTFYGRWGLIGGRLVPELALRLDHRIEPEKQEEVAEFLSGFGLTPAEAEEVIQAVGVAPVKKARRRKAKTT
jgi:hypothetical protein